ncbi:MAG: hypothetical protein JHC95_21265, partial [Solirubrobacteraceae bacterium]|nr:hypothetical protein [Solirubrobacteraceae bacterium]
LIVFPAAVAPILSSGGAAPPVAPNPKPAPVPPPAPPTGISSQSAFSQQAAPQTQAAIAQQRQRAAELAREGSFHATAYEPRDSGIGAGAWIGGAGFLLAAGSAGAVVGHRRRVAQHAAARAN